MILAMGSDLSCHRSEGKVLPEDRRPDGQLVQSPHMYFPYFLILPWCLVTVLEPSLCFMSMGFL